ncbi:MarR family transcriptional regulator [Mycobacterium sp. 236(2023)]|uniref:MarR family winged helix-turn-helix transcriptional regulator n=1 Tax=Mycobacterium sp. 236(2023) TaxID=3038163 RepID=UPI0024152F5E|nr:MarR family transcriptional regulator [Mycobacterium sp. 236(2023)]MDG4669436.1 MarR family transcriptional regulator [Mycobacterium sp. 236(2023)]
MHEQPNTAVLMFIAHREVETRVMSALARDGFDDITIAQSRLMQRLDPAGMRLTELADQARVTKQTAGALVDQLERSGYVTRLPDPTDARARLVTLSKRGTEVCRRAAQEVARVEDEWRKHLGDKAYNAMRAALLQVNSA